MRSILFAVFFLGMLSERVSMEKNLTSITTNSIPAYCNVCFNRTAKEMQKFECCSQSDYMECYGGYRNSTSKRRFGKTKQIVFCEWAYDTFNPAILLKFPRLERLRIEHGLLFDFVNDFPPLKHIMLINISYTRLAHLQPTLFKQLPQLKIIDLRWNQLVFYDGSLILPNHFQRLYISENPYNCTKNFKWIMNQSITKHIFDRNLLQCNDIRFKNHSVLTVMNIKKSLREICYKNEELRNCTCILSYIALHLDEVWRPIYSINCNHLNLTRLPASLPQNTTTFHAQYNNIHTIQPLPSAYYSVQDIFLDYNQIDNIETLETDNWLDHFRAFSLKGNKLSKLPIYLLNNALERNHQASALYLSENPWICDCNFMLRFQELLQSHRSIVKDASEIQCSKRVDDDVVSYSILGLKRSDVCTLSPEYSIHPLDMLNAVLATFLIIIIAKLSYDYYNYRVRGHLPWIVSKLP